MTPAPALYRGLRVIASVLLALGAIGAVCAAIGLAVSGVAAREHIDTAFDVFIWSGGVLGAAAGLVWLSRALTKDKQ